MGCVSVSAKSRKLFADPMQLLLTLLLTGMIISWAATYIRLFLLESWKYGGHKEGEPLTEQDLKRTLKCKKYTFMGDGILILGVIALAFLSSMEALISFILSSTLIVLIALFVRKWVRENGSGSNRDDWMTYLVGVGVACMILIPLCNGAATHFLAKRNRTPGENRRYWQVMKKVIPVEKALTDL